MSRSWLWPDSRAPHVSTLRTEHNALVNLHAKTVAVLRTLCSVPEGSHTVLGAHDNGPHYVAAVDAWNAAHDLLAELDAEAKS